MKAGKELIRQRFRRAAATYDAEAAIQRTTAEYLLGILEQVARIKPRYTLEIGSCTGILTSRFLARYHGAVHRLYLNDLVDEMQPLLLRKIADHLHLVTFLPGDIEEIEIPGGLTCILSSSTFHWLHDPGELLQRLAAGLAPGGILAFSLYGPDNMREIREICGIGLRYRCLEETTRLLPHSMTLLAAREYRRTLWFRDGTAVLRHLRRTGVNALRPEPWNRKRLARFNAAYREHFSGPRGAALTYHPLFIVAVKAP